MRAFPGKSPRVFLSRKLLGQKSGWRFCDICLAYLSPKGWHWGMELLSSCCIFHNMSRLSNTCAWDFMFHSSPTPFSWFTTDIPPLPPPHNMWVLKLGYKCPEESTALMYNSSIYHMGSLFWPVRVLDCHGIYPVFHGNSLKPLYLRGWS